MQLHIIYSVKKEINILSVNMNNIQFKGNLIENQWKHYANVKT